MGSVTYKEGYRVNSRGQRLLTVEYLCEQAPKALLFWQHGYGEHIGRYRSGAPVVSTMPVLSLPALCGAPSPCSASKQAELLPML